MKLKFLKGCLKQMEINISENQEKLCEAEIFKRLFKTNELNRDIVQNFIKNIYVYSKDDIEIEWNFKKS